MRNGLTMCVYCLNNKLLNTLFNTNSAIFQQYHGMNNLIFNEMMMSALY